MREYRRYRCDEGHEWTLCRDSNEAERKPDGLCPQGHEAVTCSKELPADEVQVVLRPAARIVDAARGQVWHAGTYWLVLLDRADVELCVSRERYSWDDVIRLAGLFRGSSRERALLLWQRRRP